MTALNRNISSLLFYCLLFLALSYASPFKDLNIEFLLADSTKTSTKKHQKNKKKDGKKSFRKIIKDYEKIEGLFTLYWNEEKN